MPTEATTPRRPLALRFGAALALGFVPAVLTATVTTAFGGRALAVGAATLLVGLPLGVALALRVLRPTLRSFRALRAGVRAFEEGDFSLRLPASSNAELEDVVDAYNRMGDVLRDERIHLHQKEWMLETVLSSTPMGIVLMDGRERVIYANRAARRLLSTGAGLEGKSWSEVLARGPAELAETYTDGADALFHVELAGNDESFHLSQRAIHLQSRPHTLVMIRRMTPELRRQEVQVWKKIIRLMGHELNNSLAPIASLAHSARKLVEKPAESERLIEVFETIEERARHLKDFLEGYARFARLPEPRKSEVELAPFVSRLAQVCRFRVDGDTHARGWFDATQIEQVLINVLKNASESGSPPEEIVLSVHAQGSRGDGGVRFVVRDRGKGMTEAERRDALLPFHSSKKDGTGLGLALCQEILDAHRGGLALEQRREGGMKVTCRVPGKGASQS